MKILAIQGSLRVGSNNRKLLKEIIEHLPVGVKGEIAELHDIPLFNGDVHAKGFPVSVDELRDKIRQADGVIISVPEYNYSFSGVLKNALDWASLAPQQPFNGKPVGIVSTSSGMFGGVRAQGHIRQVLQYVEAITMPKPEVIVPQGQLKFDEAGKLTDEKTLKAIEAFTTAFVGWVTKMKSAE